MNCDIWAARSIAEVFKQCKIDYPQTEKGNPSFTKSFLENHPHPIPKAIVQARMLQQSTDHVPYIHD